MAVPLTVAYLTDTALALVVDSETIALATVSVPAAPSGTTPPTTLTSAVSSSRIVPVATSAPAAPNVAFAGELSLMTTVSSSSSTASEVTGTVTVPVLAPTGMVSVPAVAV